MLLTALGTWLIAGAILATCLVGFWDEIKEWLNTVAADVVENTLGYGARERMYKTVATVNRLMDKLKNTSVIYTKKSKDSLYYDKTTIVAEQPVEEVTEDVLKEFTKHNNRLVQEFEYKH